MDGCQRKSKSTPIPDDLINLHFEQNKQKQGLTFPSVDDDPNSSAAPQQVVDKSRKGAVDSRIISLVESLNHPTGQFFTTSSCSGRAILFTHDSDADAGYPVSANSSQLKTPEEFANSSEQTRKKGCKWLYVSHDEVDLPQFIQAWKDTPGGTNAVFKMEPCIIHVQCKALSIARKLVHLATESGFRNSGMVIGKDNKITAAVRSAIGLEVPLRKENIGEQTFVNSEYISYIVNCANEKLIENWKRSEHLRQEFVKTFPTTQIQLN